MRVVPEIIQLAPRLTVIESHTPALCHQRAQAGRLIKSEVGSLLIVLDNDGIIERLCFAAGESEEAAPLDAIIRLVPGVISDETSALFDSFQDNLLAPPVYTRPPEYKGSKVPEILLSGHQRKIDEWRFEAALKRTKERRPDLLED